MTNHPQSSGTDEGREEEILAFIKHMRRSRKCPKALLHLEFLLGKLTAERHRTASLEKTCKKFDEDRGHLMLERNALNEKLRALQKRTASLEGALDNVRKHANQFALLDGKNANGCLIYLADIARKALHPSPADGGTNSDLLADEALLFFEPPSADQSQEELIAESSKKSESSSPAKL